MSRTTGLGAKTPTTLPPGGEIAAPVKIGAKEISAETFERVRTERADARGDLPPPVDDTAAAHLEAAQVLGEAALRALSPDTTEPGAPALHERYEIRVPAHRFRSSDVSWKWQRSVLDDQVKAVAGFLADLHTKTRGSRGVGFDRVALEPARFGKPPVSQQGRTLVVSVPRPPLAFGPQTIEDLEKRFAKGEHLPESTRKVWPLLNPAGLFRAALSKVVEKVTVGLSDDLRTVAKLRGRDDLRSRLLSLVEAHVDPEAKGKDGQPVREVAKKKIMRARTAGLRRIAQSWLQQLDDPSLRDAVPEALAASAQAVRSKDVKVKQRVFSLLVGVSNVHDIGVDVHLTDGRLLPYVTQVPSKVDIDAVVIAPLVATHTVDLIQVDLTAQRSAGQLVPTATLDWALASR